ncbi:hypothetical protein JCM9492_05140 [Aquifex pyrophilus]
MKNLEQLRCKVAYECVKEIKDMNNDKLEEKYSSLARRLPAMIAQNGLLTTIAFIHSKGEEEHEKVLNHLLKYVEERFGKKYNTNEFITELYNMKTEIYLFYTNDLLNFAVWLKRMAEGELKHEDKEY